jgi:hypothetical protein
MHSQGRSDDHGQRGQEHCRSGLALVDVEAKCEHHRNGITWSAHQDALASRRQAGQAVEEEKGVKESKSQRWHGESRRLLALLLAFGVAFGFSSPTGATELKQPTAQAFDRYVQLTEVRIRSELAGRETLLYFDSLPERERNSILARVHSGQVVIEPIRTHDNGKEIHVPDGLVHDWLAIGFIPGATLEQVVALAQDYPRHPELYAPDVQRARVLSRVDQHFSVYYRFYRHAIVTAVYDTEFGVDYFMPDTSRGYCFARSLRIAEVQNVGRPDEKELPVGNDHGYMWRLNLYTRYLEKDNGVYMEIEFVALSRSVPRVFALLVNPYLRSIPREYLTNYIHATQKALSPNSAYSRALD